MAWQRRWLSSSDPRRILFGLKNERKKGAAGPWPVTLLLYGLDAASVTGGRRRRRAKERKKNKNSRFFIWFKVETCSFMSGYE